MGFPTNDNRLGANRLYQGTITFPSGATAPGQPITLGGTISHGFSLTVLAASANVAIKVGATTEPAIPVVANQVRDNLVFDALFVTGPAGMSLTYEVQGR